MTMPMSRVRLSRSARAISVIPPGVALMLVAITLAGCGSSTPPTSSESLKPVAKTQITTAPVTSTTSTTEPDTNGHPSFTINVAEPDGDDVTVEGWFGSVVPASRSSVSQTVLNECPSPAPDGRAMVTQLDLATTVQSRLPAEVELQTGNVTGGLMDFIMGDREGARCTNGEPGVTTTNLGKLQPHQTNRFTLWVVLPDTITPDRPEPTEQQLGKEERLMVLPIPGIKDYGSTENNEAPKRHVSGPRVVTCQEPGFVGEHREEYLAVTNDSPKTLNNNETPCPTTG